MIKNTDTSDMKLMSARAEQRFNNLKSGLLILNAMRIVPSKSIIRVFFLILQTHTDK